MHKPSRIAAVAIAIATWDKMRVIGKSAMLAGLFALRCSNCAFADQIPAATICAGAARLDSGSIVAIGQPFVGLMAAGDNSVTLSVGIVPVLAVSAAASGPPRLDPGSHLVKGLFQMTFPTWPGASYEVQASTNLTAWIPIWTGIAAGFNLSFEDASTTNYAWRFYRVMVP